MTCRGCGEATRQGSRAARTASTPVARPRCVSIGRCAELPWPCALSTLHQTMRQWWPDNVPAYLRPEFSRITSVSTDGIGMTPPTAAHTKTPWLSRNSPPPHRHQPASSRPTATKARRHRVWHRCRDAQVLYARSQHRSLPSRAG